MYNDKPINILYNSLQIIVGFPVLFITPLPLCVYLLLTLYSTDINYFIMLKGMSHEMQGGVALYKLKAFFKERNR